MTHACNCCCNCWILFTIIEHLFSIIGKQQLSFKFVVEHGKECVNIWIYYVAIFIFFVNLCLFHLHHCIVMKLLIEQMCHAVQLAVSHCACSVSPHVFCVSPRVFCVSLHVFCVSQRVFCVSLHVFCVSLRVFCVSLHVFCVSLHVFCVSLHVFCVSLRVSCMSLGVGDSGWGAAARPRGAAHRLPAATLPPHLHHPLHRAQRARAHPRVDQLWRAAGVLQHPAHPAAQQGTGLCVRLAGAGLSPGLHWAHARPHSSTEGLSHSLIHLLYNHLLRDLVTLLKV